MLIDYYFRRVINQRCKNAIVIQRRALGSKISHRTHDDEMCRFESARQKFFVRVLLLPLVGFRFSWATRRISRAIVIFEFARADISLTSTARESPFLLSALIRYGLVSPTWHIFLRSSLVATAFVTFGDSQNQAFLLQRTHGITKPRSTDTSANHLIINHVVIFVTYDRSIKSQFLITTNIFPRLFQTNYYQLWY